MAIGPDGTFPLGSPINELDRGGLYAGFTVNKPMRLGLMQFGATVNWLAGSSDEMQQLATAMRSKCIKAFGNLPYDKSTLPIRVTANRDKGLIELRLPQSAETLAANPEMWLALSEVIETTISSMKAGTND
jgi:hypothetical protein